MPKILSPVTISRLHPLAVAEADTRSGGDRTRWQIEDDRCVLVVNYPGWRPSKTRKAGKH